MLPIVASPRDDIPPRRLRGRERLAIDVGAGPCTLPTMATTQRIYNFSAGPAAIPDAVLQQAQALGESWS